MSATAKCHSCQAPIEWVRMAKSGKAHPCDARGEKRVVIGPEGGYVAVAYRSHFSTCPNADRHRKR